MVNTLKSYLPIPNNCNKSDNNECHHHMGISQMEIQRHYNYIRVFCMTLSDMKSIVDDFKEEDKMRGVGGYCFIFKS